jgi:hypothetical protein
MEYEPGLGCPYCKDAFYDTIERSRHIRNNHPGGDTGPTRDMEMMAAKTGLSLASVPKKTPRSKLSSPSAERITPLFRDRRKS